MEIIDRLRYAWHVVKRGFNFYDGNGNRITFQDWSSKFIETKHSPIVETAYTTFASEFSKLDFFVYREFLEKDEIKYDDMKNNRLNKLLQLRPNELLTAHDFKYIMAYQYAKYGKAIAVINRDQKGNVYDYTPLDMANYEFGCGYKLNNGKTFLKTRNKTTGKIELMYTGDLIFLRNNPNEIFQGDKSNLDNSTLALTRLFDTQLNVLMNEMLKSGEIRGIVEIGSASLGGLNQSLASKDKKISKQDEITERIKKAGGGVLVLDAGEKWQDMKAPFRTMSVDEQNNLTKMIYSFKGINEKVVNGTANESEMEIYFNKIIAPFSEQYKEEMNYKSLNEKERDSGTVIDCRRNPFEYISIDKAMNSAYKGAMFTTKNEMRKMVFKFGPLAGGDKLIDNLNFVEKEEQKTDE
jgi:phage portal protein BeeE